ncbi:MAG: hypothetical protein KBD50_03640 [Candidatus Pacebacteria bacterium]|nr:hypothetical protein [Candidatus Paceibacterota bacterium]
MKTFASKSLHALLVGIVALVVMFVYGWLSSTQVTPLVYAQSTTGLAGYAWSETIGWISFSCTTGGPTGNSVCSTSNYSVAADVNGNLTGYAWSDNIGWIKFGGLSSFPTGSGTVAQNAQVSGANVIGWARACAGTASGICTDMTSRTDGWDGWIALSGTWTDVTVSGTNVSGYAWGGDVVGWIDFDLTTFAANTPVPSVTTYAQTGLTTTAATLEGGANPNGFSTTGWFRYSTTDPGTCNDTFGTRAPASGGDALGSGTALLAFDNPVTGLTHSTTYYYCALASNAGGTAVGAVRFFTTSTPAQCADGIDNEPDGFTDMADSGCTGSGDNVEVNTPSLSLFTASEIRVHATESVTLTWSGAELPPTCTITSNPVISGGTGTPRSVPSTGTANANASGEVVGPITQTTVITLNCGAGASAQKTITIVPDIIEI